ncbi:MAG: hypothetical protein ABL893_08845 [Hyphomicrobium sp.]
MALIKVRLRPLQHCSTDLPDSQMPQASGAANKLLEIRAMKNSIAILAALTFSAVIANSAALAGPPTKQLTIDAGKGVIFQLGRQSGVATFTQEAGACGLSVVECFETVCGVI